MGIGVGNSISFKYFGVVKVISKDVDCHAVILLSYLGFWKQLMDDISLTSQGECCELAVHSMYHKPQQTLGMKWAF